MRQFGVFLFFILVVLTNFQTFADVVNPTDLQNEDFVVFGEGNARQTYAHLRIADLPSLHTRVIYSKEGLVKPNSKGIVILLPGTSGNINSVYGIKQSLGPLANVLYKMGYSPIAFQPPIYFHADRSESERAPYVDQYGNLEGNLNWLQSIFAFIEKQNVARLPTFGIFRSTFAAVGLEALHLYLQGDPRFTFFSNMESLGAFGLDGHSPEEIAAWHAAEVAYFNKQTGDLSVIAAAPKIFGGMTHQSETLEPAESMMRRPKVFLTAGSLDEFVDGKVHRLFGPILKFANAHPDVVSTLVWHDGFHDPSRGIPKKHVPTMTRMKILLGILLSPDLLENHSQLLYLPDVEQVIAPLSIRERVRCGEVLAGFLG